MNLLIDSNRIDLVFVFYLVHLIMKGLKTYGRLLVHVNEVVVNDVLYLWLVGEGYVLIGYT